MPSVEVLPWRWGLTSWCLLSVSCCGGNIRSEENKSPSCGDGCSDCFGGCSSGQGCGEGSGENKLPVISLDTPCGVVQIPSYYQRIASSPDDPKASAAFAARSKEALCLFLIYPCPKEEELPYDHPEELISSIHEILGDNQGLVEVNAGKTDHEVPYITETSKVM